MFEPFSALISVGYFIITLRYTLFSLPNYRDIALRHCFFPAKRMLLAALKLTLHQNFSVSMKKILSIILTLTTFCSFQIGVTFKHTHYYSNGSVVEHSHPFCSHSPLNEPSHHHHTYKYPFIGGCFISTAAPLIYFVVFLASSEFSFQPFISSCKGFLLIKHQKSRAPPAFS